MGKKLKVLFASMEGIGHVNACISLGQALLRAGHQVLFALSEPWRPRMEALGFEFVSLPHEIIPGVDNPMKFIAENMVKTKAISDILPLDRITGKKSEFARLIELSIQTDAKLTSAIDQVRPDVIVCDVFMTMPSIVNSGIPWVWTWSANPLYMYGNDYDLPVFRLGLSIEGNHEDKKEIRDKVNQADYDAWKKYNEYVVSKGLPPLTPNQFADGSPFLNIYGFPEELDYKDIKPLPKHYVRFDNLMRTEVESDKKFEIPKELTDKPGKLIYFSLGSVCAADTELMKRLVGILAESKHRFIVSKGPLHERYELADNMWGKASLPQLEILPVVDLVITHGGNNTVCETFYFGKPMIVLPFFGDQPDNAQRIHEKGFGERLDPYRCSKQELLESIDKLLNDKGLQEKMKKISQRIQSEKSIDKFPKLIEQLVK